MNHSAFTGAIAETKVHSRPLLDQLRSHRRRETPGVCSRAIQEIERLRGTIDAAIEALRDVRGDLTEHNRIALAAKLELAREASK